MSYYCFNREEVLQKAKEKYNCGGREKSAEYYRANKYVLKEKAKNRYIDFSEEEKKVKKEYLKNRYKEIKNYANLFLSYKNE